VVRLIKRYGSRKLYDTEESRYVSLEEIGAWVRDGQEVRVVDNDSSEDVTAQTLTQVILDEGRRHSTAFPSSEVLHDLIRRGSRLVTSGVEQLNQGVDRILKASVDRIRPVREVREETRILRRRLEELEVTLARIESRHQETVEHEAGVSGTQATTGSLEEVAPGESNETDDEQENKTPARKSYRVRSTSRSNG